MYKTKKNIKKFISVLLALLMMISIFPIMSFGADVNLGELSGADEVSIDVTRQYGHEVHTTEVDGTTYPLFCIEYGTTSPSSSYKASNRSGITDEAVLEAARWIFAGYYMEHGNSIDWLDMAYCQKKVWSVTGRETDWTFSDEGYNEWCANAENNKRSLDTRPSFDFQNIGTIVAGKSTTVSDTNRVLKDYPAFVYEQNGVTISHNTNSNYLIISVSKTCTLNTFAIPNGYYRKSVTGNDDDLLLYFSNGNTSYQKLIYSAYYDPVTFSLSGNVVPLGHIEITKNDNYSTSVNGATFGLYSDRNCNNLVSQATSSNGKVRFEYLEPNTYYVKEISAPNGFLLNTDVTTVTVSSNNTAKNTVIDAEPTGTINLVKDLDVSKTNGKYGDVVISEAEYTLYAKDKITSKNGSKTFYQKDAVVSTKKITNDGSGIRGSLAWSNLPLGSYYIKETKAPTGTFKDNNTYNVTLSYVNQTTPVIINNSNSTDVVKCMKVKVFKEGTDGGAGLVQGIPDAEFTIKLYADVLNALNNGYSYDDIWNGRADNICPTYAKVATDADGNAVTNYLPYGQYITRETNTPTDYSSGDDFTFSINKDESEVAVENKVKLLVVNNTPFEAPVQIVKRDVDSNKIVSLSSAVFKIRATEDIKNKTTGEVIYHNGDFVKVKVGTSKYDEFMTNSDGFVVPAVNGRYASANDEKGTTTTPFKLQAGSYEIIELETPNGFLINSEPLRFVVTSVLKNSVDADGDVFVSADFVDTQPKAEIVINKKIDRRTVDTTLIDYDNIDYTGISFELSAHDDILDMADGSVIYQKGEVIGTYNLNDDATLTIDDLWLGDYSVKEIATLDGLVLDENEYVVTFEYEDDTTELYTKTLDISNSTTEIDVSKSDITGDNELEGAELEVTDAEGNVIDSWISTTENHKIEGLVVGEAYTLTENLAPLGYVVANSINFTVENTKEIQQVKMLDKIVSISKTSVTGDSELEGAELVVTDAEGNEIDKWTSTTEAHNVVGLVEGQTYTLTENLAPLGYAIANSIEFTVSYEKENELVKMIDKQVSVSKVDITNDKELIGAELVVTDAEGNEVDKWTSTTDIHYVNGLKEGETYTLTETIAPYGFKIANSIKFTVSYDKETQTIVMKDEPYLSSVRVIKCDIQTKKAILSNEFEFSIYADKDCKELIATSGANKDEGTALFGDLRYGTYYIKETKAPLGYSLSDQVVEITINEKGVFADGVNLKENNGVYSFEYYDELLPVVKTGDNINGLKALCVMGGLLIIFIAVFIFVNKKMKKNKEK